MIKIIAILLLIPSTALAKPIKDMKKTVVLIETRESSGSGVIISSNGLIITAAHVLEDKRSAIVYVKNRPYKALVAYINYKSDVALLKIEVDNLPYSEITYDYNKLDEIYTISNPKGYRNICGKGSIVDINLDGYLPDKSLLYIVTDTIVSAGSSGGAIFNKEGELISIIYAVSQENEGYSIPIGNFRILAEHYINNLV